jgi:outer membrane receptor protein involved in Fe transport
MEGTWMRRGGAALARGSALAALAWSLHAAPALAQDPVAAPPAEDQAIIVTGTRIARPGGFNEPTPSTVFGAEQIADLAIVNAGDIMELIPQNTAVVSDAVAGLTAGADVGASYANLRGLNPTLGTRTLTMVNTRRFIPTSDGGAVDLNLIPAAMIERVETVTGGGSAAYGSDAVAGVVNILLDTDLEGLRGQIDYGQTFRGDGQGWHASLVYGAPIAERGHFVFGAEYEDKQGIGDCSEVRTWCAAGWDVYTNALNITPTGAASGFNVPGSPGYGQPNYVWGPNSKQAFNEPRGVVRNRAPAAVAARNQRFNEAGSGIVQFDQGQFVQSAQIGPRMGGDGASTYDDSDIQTPAERWIGYLYSEYELADWVEVNAELTYANRRASYSGVTAGPRSTFFINPDNPFIPASLRTLLAGTQFSLGKDMDGQVPNFNEVRAEVVRGVLGFSGRFAENWNWNAYYQYGLNDRHLFSQYSRVNTEFQYALDAVALANGQVTCRELTRPNPNPRAQGCSPMNLFGLDNLSDASIRYAYRPVVEDFVFDQHVAAASVNGTLVEGWAGPIGAAAGAEYRKENGDVTHGNIANYTDYAFTYGLDYGGSIAVIEAFGELNLPLLRDSAIGELVELNGAVRWTQNKARNAYTSEEKSSEAVSYKLSGIYDIGAGVRLRGSYSRDIRAPGFRELFERNVPSEEGTTLGIVDNPARASVGNDDATPILNGGSFALEPEQADTITAGLVFRPDFIRGLRVSVDWYQIELQDAVSILGAQTIVDFCGNYQLFCDRITSVAVNPAVTPGRPGDGGITFVDARRVNLGEVTVRGFDIELDYRLALADVSPALGNGVLGLRVLANNQYDQLVDAAPNVPTVDYAGQTGPVQLGGNLNPTPDWLFNGFLSYDNGGFNTTLSVRRINSGTYDVRRIGPDDERYAPTLANSISNNHVEGRTYFGLAMSYEIAVGSGGDSAVEVFGAIENLFDTEPAIAPGGGGGGGSNYPTNPVYFDTFGARFRAGVRFTY